LAYRLRVHCLITPPQRGLQSADSSPALPCRQNIDDALAKLQEMIDAAVECCTPKEADPETIKKIAKR
jgi:hypothetical protein